MVHGGFAWRFKAYAQNLCAHVLEPHAQPRTLEARRAGDQHTPSRKYSLDVFKSVHVAPAIVQIYEAQGHSAKQKCGAAR